MINFLLLITLLFYHFYIFFTLYGLYKKEKFNFTYGICLGIIIENLINFYFNII